jgi:hypothetical protein
VKPLWIVLGSALLGLAGLEALVRVRQWKRYGTTLTSYYHFTDDPETGLRIPEPGHTVGPITVNSLGFRGPEIESPKPAERVRIAFLGASTTFCAEASSLEATWPVLVLEGLAEAEPDIAFDLVNGGSGGFSVSESQLSFEKRVLPLEPDVVVFYGATNDFTRDSRKAAIAAGLYEAGEDDVSAIGKYWLTYYLVEKNVRHSLRTREGAREMLRYEPREISQGFERDLSALVRSARTHEQVVALLTFSIQMRPEQPPEARRAAAASALYYMPFLDLDGLQAGYGEYNRVIRQVARREETILIEGENDIPGDREHFADSVHFRDPGLVLHARRVLRGLLTAPEFQELLAARRSAR